MLQADPGTVRDYLQIFRLFCHEAQRVFHDRLINDEDKRYFNTILAEMSQKHFSQVTILVSNFLFLSSSFFLSFSEFNDTNMNCLSVLYFVFLYLQNVDPELFESKPILFGDFMKMGADPADRMYEEFTDMTKLQIILNDVRID